MKTCCSCATNSYKIPSFTAPKHYNPIKPGTPLQAFLLSALVFVVELANFSAIKL